MAKTQNSIKRISGQKAFRIVMILIGAACAAASIELFLVPNNIIDGALSAFH
ncbi:YitT family protein [Bacillus licheniformis]|nr:YitT family protein [Bacillus licheniformis]